MTWDGRKGRGRKEAKEKEREKGRKKERERGQEGKGKGPEKVRRNGRTGNAGKGCNEKRGREVKENTRRGERRIERK